MMTAVLFPVCGCGRNTVNIGTSRSPVPMAPGALPSHNGYVAIPRKLFSVRGVGAACWPVAVLTRVARIQSVAMLLKHISLFYRGQFVVPDRKWRRVDSGRLSVEFGARSDELFLPRGDVVDDSIDFGIAQLRTE